MVAAWMGNGSVDAALGEHGEEVGIDAEGVERRRRRGGVGDCQQVSSVDGGRKTREAARRSVGRGGRRIGATSGWSDPKSLASAGGVQGPGSPDRGRPDGGNEVRLSG